MAEYVQLRKELSIAEYEAMKKIKLFDEEELRKIKKTRENFDYKLEKQTKELKDFCEYLKYERSLLAIIKDRRLVRHIKEKKAIERLIGIKIHGLYAKTLARFPSDIRLWESCIKFCHGAGFVSEIPQIHDRFLQLHVAKPEVWLKVIMWEYSELHNMARVKHLLTSALKLHGKDADLNKAFVQIELIEAQTIYESEEITDAQKEKEIEIALGHCEGVYKNLKNFMELDFMIEFLHLTLQFNFAHPFSRKILMDIYGGHKNHPKTWNCFAQSELLGITLFDPSENAVGITRGPRTSRGNIEKCNDIFLFAVKQVPCQEMYTFFINAMLELNEDMSKDRKLRRSSLATAFSTAHEAGFMSENHYIVYLQLLLEGDSINTGKMEEIFNKALKDNSTDVWKLRLTYGIKHESRDKLADLFKKVTKSIGNDDILDLYKIFYSFLSTSSDKTAVETFLTTAVNSENRVISSFFKPEYVEWICLNKNMVEARKIYKDLALNSPPCLGLHEKMIAIESACEPKLIPEIRRCFDYAVQLFGFKETSIWIDYIRFEREHGNPNLSTNLYQRARATLKGDEVIQKFMEGHSLMQLAS